MSQGNTCHDVSARENKRLKVFKQKQKEIKWNCPSKNWQEKKRKTVIPFGNRVKTCVILTSFHLIAFKNSILAVILVTSVRKRDFHAEWPGLFVETAGTRWRHRMVCNVAFHLSLILEFENEIPVMRPFHNTTCKKNFGLGDTYHLHGEKGEILFGNKTVWKASENTDWLEPIYCFYCFLISFFFSFFLKYFQLSWTHLSLW